MPLDTSHNTSFSRTVPGLQLAVDSTSLGEFKLCPRRYYYNIVCGYQAKLESVDLQFGILLHSSVERYHRAKAQGNSHDEALLAAYKWVLGRTWNRQLNRPWNSGNADKNRFTLIRTLVWYLDQWRDDSLETVIFADGSPAVELSFQFDSGLRTAGGEAWVLCGHLDRLARLNGVPYIPDVKTTKSTLGPSYFEKFSPDNQFSLYTLAGRVVYHEPVAGLILDAVQVAVTFSRFERALVQRDSAQVDEWLADTGQWLGQMEHCAVTQHWPMNDKSCHQYGGCAYRRICARSPASRQTWLESEFKQRTWDPLTRRTDV